MHYFYIFLAELRWSSSRTRATCFLLRMKIISAASDLSAACMWFTDRHSHRPHDIHTSRDIHLPFLIAHEAASFWCSTLSSFSLLRIIVGEQCNQLLSVWFLFSQSYYEVYSNMHSVLWVYNSNEYYSNAVQYCTIYPICLHVCIWLHGLYEYSFLYSVTQLNNWYC